MSCNSIKPFWPIAFISLPSKGGSLKNHPVILSRIPEQPEQPGGHFSGQWTFQPSRGLPYDHRQEHQEGRTRLPVAWDLGHRLGQIYTLKDERIWCQDDIRLAPYGLGNAWVSNTFHHYCLQFRNETPR